MPKTLKVYRTSTGFHDAYVAAPSKAAALRAWGSERDLFALGAAEEVTDTALTKSALARPGTVIKQSRGSEAEQIAALGTDEPRPKIHKATPPGPKAKPKPRPHRIRLDKAEAALSAAGERQAAERADLEARERALRDERHKVEARQRAEIKRLQTDRDKAAEVYGDAMRDWRG